MYCSERVMLRTESATTTTPQNDRRADNQPRRGKRPGKGMFFSEVHCRHLACSIFVQRLFFIQCFFSKVYVFYTLTFTVLSRFCA